MVTYRKLFLLCLDFLVHLFLIFVTHYVYQLLLIVIFIFVRYCNSTCYFFLNKVGNLGVLRPKSSHCVIEKNPFWISPYLICIFCLHDHETWSWLLFWVRYSQTFQQSLVCWTSHQFNDFLLEGVLFMATERIGFFTLFSFGCFSSVWLSCSKEAKTTGNKNIWQEKNYRRSISQAD